MRKHYPTGQRYALTHVETLYRTLDAGLCCGLPVAAGVGVEVRAIERPAAWSSWKPGSGSMTDDKVLAVATIDGAPAYGWLALGWLEPINPQRNLFEVEQPSLF